MSQTITQKLPVQEIVDAYLAGTPGPALARRYEVGNQIIYHLLRQNGVSIRSKGGKDKVLDTSLC